MHPLIAEVGEQLRARALIPRGVGCVLAISGGLDSMVLLRVMTELQPVFGWKLVIAHFNHGLRGTEADEDEAFVARAAESLRMPFVAGAGNVRQFAVERSESIETAGRRLRHAFLAKVAREHGADRVATAHHADDQAELFLMRLLRGAGGVGLSGMAEVSASPADARIQLVRPLLHLSRAALQTAAGDLGVTWREDVSNEDVSLFRNRVRHELIPLLTSRFQPALLRVLDRERRLIRDQAEAVRLQAEAWLSRRETAFAVLPAAVQREVIRQQLEASGVGFDFDLIESLREHADTTIEVEPRRYVRRAADGTVRVKDRPASEDTFSFEQMLLPLDEPSGRIAFGGVEIQWKIEPIEGAERPARTGPETVEYFDADAVGQTILLRHWRPGDRFQPIGLGVPAKLQDLFSNARTPAAERRRRVLAVTADGEVFWVEGLRIGERAKLSPQTRRRLSWKWARLQGSLFQAEDAPAFR